MAARITESEWIWKDGEFIRWQDATVHILSLGVQFGSSIFEGMRCYKTAAGRAIFRLDAHIDRLFDSCKVYRIEIDYSRTDLIAASLATRCKPCDDASRIALPRRVRSDVIRLRLSHPTPRVR